jgi:hypothetical protein
MKGSWFLFPFIGRKLRRLSLVFLSLRERDVRRKVIWKLLSFGSFPSRLSFFLSFLERRGLVLWMILILEFQEFRYNIDTRTRLWTTSWKREKLLLDSYLMKNQSKESFSGTKIPWRLALENTINNKISAAIR